MESYATIDDLRGRLDWALDADEDRIARSALEDASDLARGYGRDWESATAPRLVRTLVLKAVARYLRNPDGFTQSRAGDETLAWNDAAGPDAGTVHFTNQEQKLLKALAGNGPRLVSAPISAWGPQRKHPAHMRPSPGMVAVEGGERPFPLYACEDWPW